MKWFRRKRKAETMGWTYWCGDCGGVYRLPATDSVSTFVAWHKACHRGESLMKDWS